MTLSLRAQLATLSAERDRAEANLRECASVAAHLHEDLEVMTAERDEARAKADLRADNLNGANKLLEQYRRERDAARAASPTWPLESAVLAGSAQLTADLLAARVQLAARDEEVERLKEAVGRCAARVERLSAAGSAVLRQCEANPLEGYSDEWTDDEAELLHAITGTVGPDKRAGPDPRDAVVEAAKLYLLVLDEFRALNAPTHQDMQAASDSEDMFRAALAKMGG